MMKTRTSSLERFLFGTSGRACLSATVVVLLAGAFGPVALLRLLNDGGFPTNGQTLELATWPRIEGSRAVKVNGGINTDLRTMEGNIEHKDILLKTGHAVHMREVPVQGPSTLTVQVRVDPVWNAGAVIEPVVIKLTAGPNAEEAKSVELILSGPRNVTDRWHDLTIDISQFEGKLLVVTLQTTARSDGIWTNWRDPRIAPTY
ncbi:hypothetical protein [Cupriavidus oxalaticus]|uniref:hypothetical protein n=1 Tax=Cupriavidus oxalaticus TaxID=96344 RepID=UPI003F731641